MDTFQYLASIGGMTGILASVIFMAYRHSVSQMREDRRFMEDRLSQIIDAYNNTTSENTKVLAELYTYLKAKNGGK